jgi:hypothetical protein
MLPFPSFHCVFVLTVVHYLIEIFPTISPLLCLHNHIEKNIKYEDLKISGMQISARLVSKIKASMSEPTSPLSEIHLPPSGKEHAYLYSPRTTRLLLDCKCLQELELSRLSSGIFCADTFLIQLFLMRLICTINLHLP